MNDLEKIETTVLVPTGTQETSTEAVRVLKEVEGAIVVALKYPRNNAQVYSDIISDCERPSLASKAMYSYPRGGKTVTGPSIRLAEVFARNYGNLAYGTRELSRTENESKMEAYCWDMQKNVRVSRTFDVPHVRETKQGPVKLRDSRDIYEMTANMGARRLRACILEVIPVDIVEDAIDRCRKTLGGHIEKNMDVFRRELVAGFSKAGVSIEMIEKRLGHKIDQMDREEALEYKGILVSILDNISKRSDWFKFEGGEIIDDKTEELNKKIESEAVKKKAAIKKLSGEKTLTPEEIDEIKKEEGGNQ